VAGFLIEKGKLSKPVRGIIIGGNLLGLLPVVDKFPDQYIIRYNLACYACQLGNLKEARDWLKKAIDMADTKEVKLMALNDPDLEPLRQESGQTPNTFE